MGNVIDYLIQYGDQAFAERAFCDVDVLILAQLSYFDFGSAVPTIAQHKKSVTLEEIDRTADLSAVFADKWYGENNRKLWNALLAGRRFRTMRCNYYRERMEEEQEAQFGAVTFSRKVVSRWWRFVERMIRLSAGKRIFDWHFENRWHPRK